MNEVIQFVTRFFRYAFLGQINRPISRLIVPIEEVNIAPKQQSEQAQPSQEQVRNKLIIIINWFIGIICIISFIFLIVYAFIKGSDKAFDTIQDAFLMTLSWFGGAITTFFGMEQNKRQQNN